MIRTMTESWDTTTRMASTLLPDQQRSRLARGDLIISIAKGSRRFPYEFTTPFKLVEDFFTHVEQILKEEGML